jgi:hypothetical protein
MQKKIAQLIGIAFLLTIALGSLIMSFATYDSMGGIGMAMGLCPGLFIVILGVVLGIWALSKNKNKPLQSFEEVYVRFLKDCKSTPVNLKLVSPELKPFLNRLYDALMKRPVDTEPIKQSLINLLTFLITPEGRTRDNLWMANLFVLLDDRWEVKGFDDLPESFQDILGRMLGMHDTFESPETARQFASTPEELLEQAKKL